MGDDRIENAIARIETALARIEAARPLRSEKSDAPAPDTSDAAGGPARVLALVNSHEKLREDVAETLRDLDELIAGLEE